jgi:hypothetical protein
MLTTCRACIAAVLLALITTADAAALVEHSLDAGQSFITAGRIHLQENDAVSGVFERKPLSSTQLSQMQQLVESDRWGGVGVGRGRLPFERREEIPLCRTNRGLKGTCCLCTSFPVSVRWWQRTPQQQDLAWTDFT